MNRPAYWLSAFASVILFLQANDVRAQQAWKTGDLWDLKVEAAGKPAFIVHAMIAGSEKIDGAACWQLQFLPGNGAPPHLAKQRHRVVIDQKSGQPLRALRLADKQAIDVEKAGSATFVTGLPADLPLEVIPVSSLTEGRAAIAGSTRSVVVRRQLHKDYYFLEMTLFDNDVEAWSTSQQWMPGEKWWHRYERRIKGVVDLTADRLNAPPFNDDAKIANAKEWARFKKLHPLGGDPKLRQALDISKESRLPYLLDRIEKSSGRKLTLAENLAHHSPDFKGVTPANQVLLYIVMEIIEKIDLEDGRWVKTDDGYRLEGESRAIRAPARPVWPWLVAGSVLIAAAAAGYCWRRKRAAPAKASAA